MFTVARTVDLLALGYAFGATVWFFFVQSPVLVKRLGRNSFVPLQMSLVVPFFKSLSVALLLMIGAAFVHTGSVLSGPVITAVVAFCGAVVNAAFVVPRALRAGGQSMQESLKADDQKSVARFASDGGGKVTAFWHRAVVLFVVVMLAGLVPHAVGLV